MKNFKNGDIVKLNTTIIANYHVVDQYYEIVDFKFGKLRMINGKEPDSISNWGCGKDKDWTKNFDLAEETSFKEGDKVRRKDGKPFSNREYILTVSSKRMGINPYLRETNTWIDKRSIELVKPKESRFTETVTKTVFKDFSGEIGNRPFSAKFSTNEINYVHIQLGSSIGASYRPNELQELIDALTEIKEVM